MKSFAVCAGFVTYEEQGTGLSDATEIHGQYILDTVKLVSPFVYHFILFTISQVQRYTALTIGNHDIGTAPV